MPYLSRVLGTHPQNLLNWKYNGKVPLDRIGQLCRLCNVPPEAFNYEEVCDLLSKNIPWEQVVASCGFPDHVQKMILTGKHPKELKFK